jgi:hypothetical protein
MPFLLFSPQPTLHPSSSHQTGTRGSPWRLEAKKSTSAVTASAFANFSQALLAPGAAAAASTKSNGAVYAPPGAAVGAGSNGGGTAVAEAPAAVGVSAQVVDYSREPMSGVCGGGGLAGCAWMCLCVLRSVAVCWKLGCWTGAESQQALLKQQGSMRRSCPGPALSACRPPSLLHSPSPSSPSVQCLRMCAHE